MNMPRLVSIAMAAVLVVVSFEGRSYAADVLSSRKGDHVVVTLDQAAIVDIESKTLCKVSKGETLFVWGDNLTPVAWFAVEGTVDGKIVQGWISTSHARKVAITQGLMAKLLAILIHILVIATIVLMISFMIFIVAHGHDSMERLLRASGLASGLLAYVAAKAYGLSIPELLAQSLSVVDLVSTGVWCIIVPALSGTLVAWFSLRMLKSSENVGARIVVLFCAFIFTMFTDVYATLAGEIATSEAKFGLPNSTFVLGVVLYMIFKYDRKIPEPTPSPHNWQQPGRSPFG